CCVPLWLSVTRKDVAAISMAEVPAAIVPEIVTGTLLPSGGHSMVGFAAQLTVGGCCWMTVLALTTTGAFAVRPGYDIWIFAFPIPAAVTDPSCTVATAALLEVICKLDEWVSPCQEPSAYTPVTDRRKVCPC